MGTTLRLGLLALFLVACSDGQTPPGVDPVDPTGDGGMTGPDASNPDLPGRTDAGTAAQHDDCDPDGPIHPGAQEILDRLDNDCDGEIDEMVVCNGQRDAFWTITEALAEADSNNLIQVCPGTYAERLVITRPVRLMGAGRDQTILDAGGAGPAIVVRQVAAPGAVIAGFTLKNGSSDIEGGGLRCESSQLALADNLFTANRAQGGGGLFASDCTMDATGNRFDGNDGRAGGGGGALFVGGTGQIAAGIFTGNRAVDGGGVNLQESLVAVRGNDISGNNVDVKGGGIFSASDATIEGNTVSNNNAFWKGGGIFILGHAPLVKANTVSFNACMMNDGGGVFLDVSSAHVVENFITENTAGDDAGGLRALTSTAIIERNTITHNHAPEGAGGGAKVSHMPSLLIDNVITDNDSGGHGGGIEFDNDASVMRGGIIQNNTAVFGGGIHLALAPWRGQLMENVQILDNHASVGGGIQIEDNYQQITLRGLTISGNHAGRGGAISTVRSNVTVSNCLLIGNTSRREGGAIHASKLNNAPPPGCPCEDFPPPEPPNLCICPPEDPVEAFDFIVAVGNTSPAGSGVWTDSPGLSIENSIFFQNTVDPVVWVQARPTPAPTPGNPNPQPPPIVPPLWRWNNTMPATFFGMGNPTGANGNITADPMFMGMPVDYHLQNGSPSINTGDPALSDMDGTRSDMGRFGGPTP